MHLYHIPQCSIQNRNGHISALCVALWDKEHVLYGICEVGSLLPSSINRKQAARLPQSCSQQSKSHGGHGSHTSLEPYHHSQVTATHFDIRFRSIVVMVLVAAAMAAAVAAAAVAVAAVAAVVAVEMLETMLKFRYHIWI